MALNEKTSPEVASIAGRILEMKNPVIITHEFWKEIQSVAASALTQAPDKPKSSPLYEAYKLNNVYKKFPTIKKRSLSDYLKD